MRATAFEFRFRLYLILAIVGLGAWSPWLAALEPAGRTTTWLWLGFQLSRLGVRATDGIALVTWLTIAIAALGAWLRVWGTACLGTTTVFDAQMLADTVVAYGPYRYMRNPLYCGTVLMLVAISVLMPPSGALLSLLLLSLFLFRIILAEEAFLAEKLGSPYLTYQKAVPRLLPRLRATLAPVRGPRQWGRAVLGELMPIGVFVSFATLSWDYNSALLERALLISFGLSLVARALINPADTGR